MGVKEGMIGMSVNNGSNIESTFKKQLCGEWMDRWTEGRMDGQMDGRTDHNLEVIRDCEIGAAIPFPLFFQNIE